MTEDPARWVVRFEAAQVNARGMRPGVFALSNGLAQDGVLSVADFAEWRVRNAFMNEAYPDPSRVDPGLFDRHLRGSAVCWFELMATHLLTATAWYLELLDRYHVGWRRAQTTDPGQILYEDAVQVVAAVYPFVENQVHLGPRAAVGESEPVTGC